MDCLVARESISRLLEWDLGPQEQADLQLHLTGCPECRKELDAFYTVRQALVRLRENPVEPPRDLAFKVMSRVMAAPPLTLAFRRAKAALIRRLDGIGLLFKTPGWTRTTLSAAALALVTVVAVGSFYLNHRAPLSIAQTHPPQRPTVTAPTVPAEGEGTPPPKETASSGSTSGSKQTQTEQPVKTELASASTGTMTSLWVNAKDLEAVNRQLSTLAGQHNADYQVYSLSNVPGGKNKEIVRITVGTNTEAGITDRILSTAAAVGKVVNTETSTGSAGEDVITAFVTGSVQ